MNILWDFDGTICNTYPAYATLFYQTIQERGSFDEVFKHLKVSFSHAFDYFQISEQEKESFMQLNRALKMDQMPPFPNIELVLQQANCNVIMTHKDRATVEKVLHHYNLAHYFKEIVTLENGFPRKPNPGSYQYLHDKYNLSLVIGDRELDLIPAKQVGFATCMFQGECEAADFSINDYREFPSAWKQFWNKY
ncbi:HAD-IA family hydrolase [Rummeliibacillus sp. NPDC094406]|uniref:HAD-IA family hydrolase n=1 Tax=Rummeliibacillus sp. NPDC094406 TaxID=3364511 RepID=UPI003829BC88